MENSGHKLLEDAASNLGDPKTLRIRADYDMSNSDQVDTTRSALIQISLANETDQLLRTVLQGPERPKIIQTILAYMKLIGDRV